MKNYLLYDAIAEVDEKLTDASGSAYFGKKPKKEKKPRGQVNRLHLAEAAICIVAALTVGAVVLAVGKILPGVIGGTHSSSGTESESTAPRVPDTYPPFGSRVYKAAYADPDDCGKLKETVSGTTAVLWDSDGDGKKEVVFAKNEDHGYDGIFYALYSGNPRTGKTEKLLHTQGITFGVAFAEGDDTTPLLYRWENSFTFAEKDNEGNIKNLYVDPFAKLVLKDGKTVIEEIEPGSDYKIEIEYYTDGEIGGDRQTMTFGKPVPGASPTEEEINAGHGLRALVTVFIENITKLEAKAMGEPYVTYTKKSVLGPGYAEKLYRAVFLGQDTADPAAGTDDGGSTPLTHVTVSFYNVREGEKETEYYFCGSFYSSGDASVYIRRADMPKTDVLDKIPATCRETILDVCRSAGAFPEIPEE